MLSENIESALNDQVTKEFYSSYFYLQMAAWLENQNLRGFARWMKVQAQEEAAHTLILFNYVNERGSMVRLGQLQSPPAEFGSVLEVFERVFKHEQGVSASIADLMHLATGEKDYATRNCLDWFISEQVEEESQVSEIIGKLKIVGSDGYGLLMLDKDMATRTFVTPAPLRPSPTSQPSTGSE